MRLLPNKTVLKIIGFILSILLTIIGIVLMQRQVLLWGGVILIGSLCLFLWSARSIEKNPLSEDEVKSLKPFLLPSIFFIASFFMTVLVILNVSDYFRTVERNHWAKVEWLLSMLLLTSWILIVARWKPIRPQQIWNWIKSNPVECGLVSVIVASSLVIRMVALTQHPYPWSGDESSIGTEAIRLLHGENTDWFNTGWSGQPNVSFLPTLFSMLIFGENIYAVKMMSVITGTLSILALYMLAREWFGREIACIASSFLIAYPFHLQFSRIGVDNIFDSLMAPLVIWLIFRAVRLKTLPSYLIAGIATGFTIYTYVGTRLVMAMALGTLLYFIVFQKGYLRNNLAQLGTYLSAVIIAVAPMVTFFFKYPSLFMTRIGQESILLNGWLTNQSALTGQPVWRIIIDQVTRTVLVFFSQNAGSNFLNFDRPYLTILGAIFFMIGLAIAFRHLTEPRHLILLAWFWSVLALGGFLTLNPPANTRLVMTIPATGLFIGLGAWQVSRVLLHIKFSKRLVYALNLFLIFILASQNIFFYFDIYKERSYFQDANGELAMEVGLRLQDLGDDYDYYLFGLPRVFAGFPTTVFLTPNIPKYDLNADSLPQLVFNSGRGAYIVAIPENESLLRQVVEKYPGGVWESIPRKVRDEVLFYAYVLPSNLSSSP